MADDYITMQQEAEYAAAKQKEGLWEAAIWILLGLTEAEAISKVQLVEYLRSEAQRKGNVFVDEDGFVTGYPEAELNLPADHQRLDKRQIAGVYSRLCVARGINP